MRKTTCISILLSVFLLSWCSLFTSCATKPQIEYVTVTETKTETVTETEYVPVYIDLSEIVEPVLSMRPNNANYAVKTGTDIKNLFDLMNNSISYMTAWEDWQNYATALEKTLRKCVWLASGQEDNQEMIEELTLL